MSPLRHSSPFCSDSAQAASSDREVRPLSESPWGNLETATALSTSRIVNSSRERSHPHPGILLANRTLMIGLSKNCPPQYRSPEYLASTSATSGVTVVSPCRQRPQLFRSNAVAASIARVVMPLSSTNWPWCFDRALATSGVSEVSPLRRSGLPPCLANSSATSGVRFCTPFRDNGPTCSLRALANSADTACRPLKESM